MDEDCLIRTEDDGWGFREREQSQTMLLNHRGHRAPRLTETQLRDIEELYTARLHAADILQVSLPLHRRLAPSNNNAKPPPQTATTRLPVLGLDEVGEVLGLLVSVVVVAVAVIVVIVSGAHIVHLVNAAALRAPLNGALAGHLKTISIAQSPARKEKTYAEPDDVVGVSRETGASGILLLTSGADENGVLDSSYSSISLLSRPLPS
jgi:hypothetical protein